MNAKKQSLPGPASRSTTTGNLGAFTLTELAVVVAIIGLLTLMVLPTLAGTKGRACAANDISNIKQTMMGMMMYCNDNNDYMPAPGWSLSSDCWITAANPPAMSPPHPPMTFQRDYDVQVSWFTGSKAPESGSPMPPRHGLLYPYLINPKLFLCPQDVVNKYYLERGELISSSAWNGAIVAYNNGQAPFKISRFKPTNILQWERDEKNTAAGFWGDFSDYPAESVAPTFLIPAFSQRHGNVAPVGRIDGSAGRIVYTDMAAWATNAPYGANDLWYNPISANGH